MSIIDERSTREVIAGVVDMKQRNPSWGCPRIAQQITLAFGIPINKDVVRRILAARYQPTPDAAGPSWLTFLGHAKDSLWSPDLFRCESAVLHTHWVLVVMDHGRGAYRFHQWQANLCILDVDRALARTAPGRMSVPIAGGLTVVGRIRRRSRRDQGVTPDSTAIPYPARCRPIERHARRRPRRRPDDNTDVGRAEQAQ
jgi:hypothetical protein